MNAVPPPPVAPEPSGSRSAPSPTPFELPDRLSPMVVKELRQGLRSRGFLIAFLLLQGLLVIAVLIAAAAAGSYDADSRSATQAAFWGMVAVPLLLFLPIAGLAGVRREMDGRTLDLILLTRLSAWRILLGKWIGLVLIAGLLAITVVPYATLRYFLGGVELAQELVALALVLGICVVLCGIAVGLSPYLSRVGRALLLLFGLLGGPQVLGMLLMFVFARRFGGLFGPVGPGLSAPSMTWPIVFGIVAAALGVLLALEYGAARIAPPGEGHAARQRLLLLALLLAAAGIATDREIRLAQLGLAAAVILPACVFAMLEAVPTALAAYHPWVRAGAARRLAGRFLYPGWPSAVLTSCLLVAALAVAFALSLRDLQPRATLIGLATVGAVFGPVLLSRCLRIEKRRWLMVLLIQTAMILAAVFVFVVKGAWSRDLQALLLPLPTAQLFAASSQHIKDAQLPQHTLAAGLTASVSVLALLALAIRAFRDRIRPLENEARLANPGAEP